MENKIIALIVIIEVIAITWVIQNNWFILKSEVEKPSYNFSENPPEFPPKWGDNPINYTQKFDGYVVKFPRVTTVHFNWDGIRDYDNVTIEKPNNTIRIIALGDSHTFGWGVELEETWPKVLEKLLNEKNKDNNKTFQVINFGLCSHGFKDYVNSLESKGLKYKPDIIIVGFHKDDLGSAHLWSEFAHNFSKNFSEVPKIAGEKYYKNLFENFDYFWETNILPKAKILNNLSSIYKFPVIMVFNINIGRLRIDDKYYNNLKNLTQKYEWEFIDVDPYLKDEKLENLILHPLDQHPSPLYYQLIARAVYEKFR